MKAQISMWKEETLDMAYATYNTRMYHPNNRDVLVFQQILFNWSLISFRLRQDIYAGGNVSHGV